MNYEIRYISYNININESVNMNESTKQLVIYDFGNIKGFLFENEFKLFKILNKDFKENIYTEYCVQSEQIPLKAISIEVYDCVFTNNRYLTKDFCIEIILLQASHQQASQHSQQASQHFQQASQHFQQASQHSQHAHKNERHKKIVGRMNEEHQKHVNEKIQQIQKPLEFHESHHTKHWTSLNQLMKHLPSLTQPEHLSQQIKVVQPSVPLNQKSYQHLRQPRNKVQTPFLNSKIQPSLQNQN